MNYCWHMFELFSGLNCEADESQTLDFWDLRDHLFSRALPEICGIARLTVRSAGVSILRKSDFVEVRPQLGCAECIYIAAHTAKTDLFFNNQITFYIAISNVSRKMKLCVTYTPVFWKSHWRRCVHSLKRSTLALSTVFFILYASRSVIARPVDSSMTALAPASESTGLVVRISFSVFS